MKSICHNRFSALQKTICVLFLILSISSCQKDPGIGGEAKIRGKVFARHYNATFTTLLSEYYVPDTYVYIVFGDDINYGKRIKTNYNGEFEFEFLYKGNYTLYTYSLDSAAIVNLVPNPPDSAMVQYVNIQDRKQLIELPDFIIYQ